MKVPTKKAKVHGFFTCVLCNSTMSREPTAAHICITPEGSLSCVNTCPDGKKLLYLEMNYLFTDKQGYLCDTCGDVFKVPVHLDTHLLKVHGIMTDRHKRCQCHICGTTFSLPSHVKKHIMHKHTLDGRARTFMCDICGKNYDRLDSMMVHKRRHHTEGKRFQCEHCPKKFFGRSQWLNHTRQHFGASNYVCRWCSQQFSSSYALKVHHRKHTGEKPYQCKQCDACFAQKTSLTVHMRKHQKLDTVPGRNVDHSAVKRSESVESKRTAEVVGVCDGSEARFEPPDLGRFGDVGMEKADSVPSTVLSDGPEMAQLNQSDPKEGRAGSGIMQMVESAVSRHNPLPPLPPLSENREESPASKRSNFHGTEGFLPIGFKPLDNRGYDRPPLAREAQWEPQGYTESSTLDRRRFEPQAGPRRVDPHGKSGSEFRPDPGADPGTQARFEPSDSAQLSAYGGGGGGGGQIVFPSFGYPGPAYYY